MISFKAATQGRQIRVWPVVKLRPGQNPQAAFRCTGWQRWG
jgi:hypothetical protein